MPRHYKSRKDALEHILERIGELPPAGQAEAWRTLVEWLEDYLSPHNTRPLRYNQIAVAIFNAGLRAKKLHGNS